MDTSSTGNVWHELHDLYFEAGHWMYEVEDFGRAAPIIERLRRTLALHEIGDDDDEAILAASCKGLIADLDGKRAGATAGS